MSSDTCVAVPGLSSWRQVSSLVPRLLHCTDTQQSEPENEIGLSPHRGFQWGKTSAPCFVLYFNQQYDLKRNVCCFLFSCCPLDGKWAVGSDCGKLRDSLRKREQGSARPALQSCFPYTLICCRGHGEVGTRTTLLRPKDRPGLLCFSSPPRRLPDPEQNQAETLLSGTAEELQPPRPT